MKSCVSLCIPANFLLAPKSASLTVPSRSTKMLLPFISILSTTSWRQCLGICKKFLRIFYKKKTKWRIETSVSNSMWVKIFQTKKNLFSEIANEGLIEWFEACQKLCNRSWCLILEENVQFVVNTLWSQISHNIGMTQLLFSK
jgi:hypothetical protein